MFYYIRPSRSVLVGTHPDQSKSRAALANPGGDIAESNSNQILTQSDIDKVMSRSAYITGVIAGGTVSATVAGQDYNCVMFNNPTSPHYVDSMPVVKNWYTGKNYCLMRLNTLS